MQVGACKVGEITPNDLLDHVKGIVFDLDGTLIHSTIDFAQMRRRTFARMGGAGVPETSLDMSKSITWNLRASFDFLAEAGSLADSRSLGIDATMIMSNIEMLEVQNTRAVQGAERAIGILIDQGYHVAVLTRGSRRYTEAALTAAGLADYFQHAVCRDDHPDDEAKPNPISMARAAGKLDLPKEDCLLVGDHETDMECALSAGSLFVGVLSGATDRAAWEALGAVRVIPDVSYLPDLFLRHRRQLWDG